MGVDAADLDGDGLQELFVTNFTRDHCTLYRNLGNLLFDDITAAQGLKDLTYLPLKWGCTFFDFDLDADLDLIFVNGHIYPQVDGAPALKETYRQLPILLRNDGGRLVDASRSAGPGLQVRPRPAAWPPAITTATATRTSSSRPWTPRPALRNDTPHADRRWVTLRLLNRHGSPALNARATVSAGASRRCGSSAAARPTSPRMPSSSTSAWAAPAPSTRWRSAGPTAVSVA
jgi:hypothetical protein